MFVRSITRGSRTYLQIGKRPVNPTLVMFSIWPILPVFGRIGYAEETWRITGITVC